MRNIWFAQTRFFQKNNFLTLGECSLSFKNLKIHCQSNSSLESWLYLRGFYEEFSVLEQYEKNVKPNSIAIDVGANVGIHTLALSTFVQEKGTVYSYEPRASICKQLQSNLALNKRMNVIVRQVGVGDRKKQIPFNENGNDFNQGAGMYDPAAQNMIEVVSLDEDLNKESRPVSLIKIDVEGMEFEVIKGAKNILKTSKPVLCIEYNSPPWKLSDLIGSIPYPVQIYRIPNNRLEVLRKIDEKEPLTGLNNLLFLPK